MKIICLEKRGGGVWFKKIFIFLNFIGIYIILFRLNFLFIDYYVCVFFKIFFKIIDYIL